MRIFQSRTKCRQHRYAEIRTVSVPLRPSKGGDRRCSNTPANISIDPKDTAQRLIDGCAFEEKPAIIADSEFAIGKLFGIDLELVAKDGDSYVGCIAVCSSTPETVLVIKAVDEASAKKISEEYLASRVDAYIHDYSNYGPDQLDKLNTCINKVVGQYAFLIITNDNPAAEKLLDELIK